MIWMWSWLGMKPHAHCHLGRLLPYTSHPAPHFTCVLINRGKCKWINIVKNATDYGAQQANMKCMSCSGNVIGKAADSQNVELKRRYVYRGSGQQRIQLQETQRSISLSTPCVRGLNSSYFLIQPLNLSNYSKVCDYSCCYSAVIPAFLCKNGSRLACDYQLRLLPLQIAHLTL